MQKKCVKKNYFCCHRSMKSHRSLGIISSFVGIRDRHTYPSIASQVKGGELRTEYELYCSVWPNSILQQFLYSAVFNGSKVNMHMGNLIIFLLFDIYATVSFYIINYATANNPVGQSLS